MNQDVGTPREGPRTEAGRILLIEHSSGRPHMARHIRATEAEARSAVLIQVEAAVGERTGYFDATTSDLVPDGRGAFVRADRLLRAIASLRDKETAK